MAEESSTSQLLLQPEEAVSETKSDGFVKIDIPDGSTSHFFVGLPSNTKSSAEFESGTLTMEEVATLALGNPKLPPPGSLTRPAISINRAASMPAIPYLHSNSSPASDSCIEVNLDGVREHRPFHRSRSAPATFADLSMGEDHVRVLRVVPKGRMTERTTPISGEEDQVDITEEEGVCRICLEALGDEAFRMECDCRGDLALVHRHCCQRWFNTRGNRTCEICRTTVRNIRVRVRILPNSMLWYEFTFVYIVSSIAYFLPIEFLKIMSSRGRIVEDPFGALDVIIVALFTSATASSFAQRKHVWNYAVAQFAVFTILFQYFQRHLAEFPALITATVCGIAFARGAGLVYLLIQKRRDARLNPLNNNTQAAAAPVELQPTQETTESHHSEASHHEPTTEGTAESHYSNAAANHREPTEETGESSHQADASILE